jgi:hypothetical protein
MTYAEIRQRVLAQLSPAMDRAEILALLHTLAYHRPAAGVRLWADRLTAGAMVEPSLH